jgi:methyl-accepting chemotaxis protein
MRLTGKAALTAGLLIAVTLAQGALTIVRAQSALNSVKAVEIQDSAFANAVRSMEAHFFAYDAQMKMYALVASRKNQSQLTRNTLQQAVAFRNEFQKNLFTAKRLAASPSTRGVLARLSQSAAAYNRDAAIVVSDDQHGRYAQAAYEETLGSTTPANAIMPLLASAVKLGNGQLAAQLAEIRNDQRAAITWAWLAALIILAILAAAVAAIQYLAVKPVLALKTIADHLSEGDVGDEIPIGANDEIGDLANAFRRIRDYLAGAGRTASAISRGDLTEAPAAASDTDVLGQSLVRLYGQLRAAIEALQQAAREMQANIDQVAGVAGQTTDATRQIATAINQTAQATGESSQGLQQIASAVQQLKLAIQQVTDGTGLQADRAQRGEVALSHMKEAQSSVELAAVRMEELALQSRATAEEGRRQIEETLAAMTRIAEVTRTTAEAIALLGKHSDRIGAIAGTISEIAAQTNLLALNANIEAARAGEHGRGFAVVADEVRKLAEQSSQEATNVSDLIETIQQTVQQSVSSMEKGQQEVQQGQLLGEETRQALHQMESAVSEVATEIGTLADTVRVLEHQSFGVEQSIKDIAQIAQDNAAAAQQMAASSTSVTDTVEGLAAIAEETAASTEEVAATGDHVADSAETLSEKAQELSSVAERLMGLVSQYRL